MFNNYIINFQPQQLSGKHEQWHLTKVIIPTLISVLSLRKKKRTQDISESRPEPVTSSRAGSGSALHRSRPKPTTYALGTGPNQHPLQEQDWASDLCGGRPKEVISLGADLGLQSELREHRATSGSAKHPPGMLRLYLELRRSASFGVTSVLWLR